MFGRAYRLPFKLLGIPILLDLSFLVILPLMAWMIGSQARQMAEQAGMAHAEALTRGMTPYVLGLIAAIGLFVCVVLHELGHAVAARMYGVEVKHITLWFLGGVAAFEEMPRQRGAEAVVGIAGPIVSFALAVLLGVAALLLPSEIPAAKFVVGYLAFTNAALAIFNLIPALPLDGGRILRSLLALKMPHHRATEIAAAISRVLAILLGVFGLLSWNFFLLAIAFFIYMAVANETRVGQVEALLRGIPVRRLMSRDVSVVPPDISLAELMQVMVRERHLGFPVVDSASGQVVGMVHLADTQGKDASLRVRDVMSPQVPVIREEADATDAFREMGKNNFGRLVVVGPDGRLAGIISKTDLMHTIKIRAVSEGIGSGVAGPMQPSTRPEPGRLEPAHQV